MSTSNQKITFIDKTSPPDKKYFKIDHELYFSAAERLSKMGMICYMYFMSQVPHTWNGIKNKDNNRNAPYEISTAHIAEITGISGSSAKNGIADLIKNGYLKPLKGNLYQFIDILPEDRLQTVEEHEEILEYEQMLKLSMDTLSNDRQEQLKNIALKNIEEEKILSTSQKKFSWE